MTEATVVSPLRILVVDDCPDTRQSLCALLDLWGHKARAADDGPEALRLAAEFRPEVVLLDLVLPGMGGYEVARQLRQRKTAPPWLVAMTGCPAPRDLAGAIEADFDQYLSKPCDPARIDCLLHSYALTREEATAQRPPRGARRLHY